MLTPKSLVCLRLIGITASFVFEAVTKVVFQERFSTLSISLV